ncbi:Protein sym-1 [Bienertia sinuspersici]
MLISISRNLSKACSLQISRNAHKSTNFSSNHQQCNSYLFSVGKVTGNSEFHIANAYFRQHSYRKFSYSSNGSKFGGFLKWYLGILESRPFITKGISSSLIFAAADITSQIITLPSFGCFDSLRTLRIAGYGLLIMGPSQHLWFNCLSRILPGTDVFTTVKKIVMGQAVFGPIMNSIFFSYNAALQGRATIYHVNVSGETREEVVARLKRDLLPTLMKGLMYWPLCDFVTFKYVPVHLQPLVNSSFAYLWTIYLTYMASLKKVGAD